MEAEDADAAAAENEGEDAVEEMGEDAVEEGLPSEEPLRPASPDAEEREEQDEERTGHNIIQRRLGKKGVLGSKDPEI